MRPLLVIALAALAAACAPQNPQRAAAGDSARCEVSAAAPGCRSELQRPDDNWRTTGFGGY